MNDAEYHARVLRVGDAVPDVALVDHLGSPWNLSAQRGRPVVLVLHRHLA